MYALKINSDVIPDQEAPPSPFHNDASSTDATGAMARRGDLEVAMNKIGSQIGELSVNIADTSGMIADASVALNRQAGEFHAMTGDMQAIAQSNTTVAEASRSAADAARATREGLADTTESINGILTNSLSDIKSMVSTAAEVTRVLNEVSAQIHEIHSFSESIRSISTQTQLLAVNAGIMAAHAGEAGRGFAVVADAVKQLADKTGNVSRDMVSRLQSLSHVVEQLQQRNTENEKVANTAHARSGEIDRELGKFTGFGQKVSEMITEIERIGDPVENTTNICTRVLAKVSELDGDIRQSCHHLVSASDKIDQLVDFSENVIGLVAASGIETEDTPLIRRCIEAAKETGRLFEAAIASGEASLADFFDDQYEPIPGTNPAQHLTRFTELTDRIMPPIQEGMLEFDPRVTFCAAVDNNGYLPTHNHKYSHPQSDDPIWNAANCRHRRIFNDRTGLAAGRNTKEFLLQTYRRDMGGGNFALMKDLSAPITIHGRHWGGLRIGFKISA